jgi:hypothetical protein
LGWLATHGGGGQNENDEIVFKDIIFRAISLQGEYLFPHFLRRIAIAHFRRISILK